MTRFVLGLTGSIAVGKTTVLRRLEALGATTIDADLVYRELVGPGTPLLASLVDRFGDGIVGPDHALDRAALGGIVFNDPAALADLDRLTHPAVIEEIDRRVALIPHGVVVIEAVKLIESGHADHCDEVWLVVADTDVQVTRLMERTILSEVDARRRVEAQPSLEPKLQRADRVIENSGSIDATFAQVDTGWQDILRRLDQ